MIRRSGGPYQYLRSAFGDLVAFLYVWTCAVVTRPSSFAITAIGFAEYAVAPFYPGCEAPRSAQKCAAAVCIRLFETFFIILTN